MPPRFRAERAGRKAPYMVNFFHLTNQVHSTIINSIASTAKQKNCPAGIFPPRGGFVYCRGRTPGVPAPPRGLSEESISRYTPRMSNRFRRGLGRAALPGGFPC